MSTLTFDHVLEEGTSDWTLLLLHGTGGDEHELVPLGRLLAPAATLLSPRGKVVEPDGARRFFHRPVQVADLLGRTEELAAFVAEATVAYGLDRRRIVGLGHSNGANVAVCLLLHWPGVLRGACLLRPTLAIEPDHIPDLTGLDVLIAAGDRDPYASIKAPERIARILRDAGAGVTVHTEPGGGHEPTAGDLLRSLRWLRETVLDRPEA